MEKTVKYFLKDGKRLDFIMEHAYVEDFIHDMFCEYPGIQISCSWFWFDTRGTRNCDDRGNYIIPNEDVLDLVISSKDKDPGGYAWREDEEYSPELCSWEDYQEYKESYSIYEYVKLREFRNIWGGYDGDELCFICLEYFAENNDTYITEDEFNEYCNSKHRAGARKCEKFQEELNKEGLKLASVFVEGRAEYTYIVSANKEVGQEILVPFGRDVERGWIRSFPDCMEYADAEWFPNALKKSCDCC